MTLSCAIHLNNLLARGCAPLVAEEGGKVIAETEYYIGPDIHPLDATLDICGSAPTGKWEIWGEKALSFTSIDITTKNEHKLFDRGLKNMRP